MLRSEMQSSIDRLTALSLFLSFVASAILFAYVHVASRLLLSALLAVFVVAHLVYKKTKAKESNLNDAVEAGHNPQNLGAARATNVVASVLESASLGTLMAYISLAVFRVL
jgi:hypothetical protein